MLGRLDGNTIGTDTIPSRSWWQTSWNSFPRDPARRAPGTTRAVPEWSPYVNRNAWAGPGDGGWTCPHDSQATQVTPVQPTQSALPVLADHRAEQEGDKRLFGPDHQDHRLIFCQPNGAYYSPDRLGARVKELMIKAGLDGVSLHSLRHTNATESLRNGVPLAEVSRRLGHADQNITLSIYSHAIPADDRAAAKIWNDALGDVIETSKKPAPPETTEGPDLRVFVGNKRS